MFVYILGCWTVAISLLLHIYMFSYCYMNSESHNQHCIPISLINSLPQKMVHCSVDVTTLAIFAFACHYEMLYDMQVCGYIRVRLTFHHAQQFW